MAFEPNYPTSNSDSDSSNMQNDPAMNQLDELPPKTGEYRQSDGPIERPRLVSQRRLRRDVIETVLLIVVVYTLVNLSTARAIIVGPSMQPNFYTGQLMVVNRLAYYFANPQRGDVVVLHNPHSECLAPEKVETTGCEDLIKRVIGLPGETVKIIQGRVYVNEVRLEEPYVKDYCHSSCDGEWVVQQDQYFVLGDNRNNSSDSHSFGPIPRRLIVGEAWVRYWPLPDVRVIPHPTYEQP
jgi:signal peptidase I